MIGIFRRPGLLLKRFLENRVPGLSHKKAVSFHCYRVFPAGSTLNGADIVSESETALPQMLIFLWGHHSRVPERQPCQDGANKHYGGGKCDCPCNKYRKKRVLVLIYCLCLGRLHTLQTARGRCNNFFHL